jgi:hypothetical protein
MSGAGMSVFGPMTARSSSVNRRVSPPSPRRRALGVDDHAPLGAAERQVHHGALPGHPHREADTLLAGHAGMEAEPALVGPADAVVLGAVAGEGLDGAVVALDGHGHLVDGLGSSSRSTTFGSMSTKPAARRSWRRATAWAESGSVDGSVSGGTVEAVFDDMAGVGRPYLVSRTPGTININRNR